MGKQQAIILFGHGSRDPQWRKPIEAVALRVAAVRGEQSVRCAFLEMSTPDLPAAAGELIQLGASSITIVPMFLGTGKHAREDLPELLDGLRRHHSSVLFRLQSAVGEDSRVLDLLAQIALE